MNKTELKALTDLFARELSRMQSIKVSCQSCEHYSFRSGPECAKWQSRPPPDVMPVGCDEWTYDHVPF